MIKKYLTVFTTLIMSILLGLALGLLLNTENQLVLSVAFVCTVVFFVLTLDSVSSTRKALFKNRKAYGQTFAKTVTTLLKPSKPHPMDSPVRTYYEVPTFSGQPEYIDRLTLYMWLRKVWLFQNSVYRHPQQSPLSQKYWEKELGGLDRYYSYMYILNSVGAIDPESTYHVKKLRLSPWNIIILADSMLQSKDL